MIDSEEFNVFKFLEVFPRGNILRIISHNILQKHQMFELFP